MPSQAREQMLGDIRKALQAHTVPMPFPEAEVPGDIYTRVPGVMEEKFALEFNALGGRFVYCADENELLQQLGLLMDSLNWKNLHTKDSNLLHLMREHGLQGIQSGEDMQHMEVGISTCEALIARTGSVLLSASQEAGRALPVYAPIHITVAFSNQLVWDLSDAIQLMQTKYPKGLPSMVTLTTGPSRTADIEKTLVVGVHGPKEVFVFFVDQIRG